MAEAEVTLKLLKLKKKDAKKGEEEQVENMETIVSRYAHYDLYVRHPYFEPGVKNAFKIRPTLADHIKDRLMFAPGVYYQRVFIFAKKYGKPKCPSNNIGVDTEAVMEEAEESIEYDIFSSESEDLSGFEEEDFDFSENVYFKKPRHAKLKKVDKSDKETVLIESKLKKLAQEVEKNHVPNKLSGLILGLGNEYIMFMFEGSEDVVGKFINNLHKISREIWCECRVFQTEDMIFKTYFDSIVTFHYPAINANEKFSPYLIEDVEFMKRQHWDLKSRLHKLCTILSPNQASMHYSTFESSEETEESNIAELDIKKYLPEVQRIELILKCKRLYHSFRAYSRIYGIIPHQKDEDASAWPLPSDYTPLGIFRRNEFDVNLTFGDYLQLQTVEEQLGSSESRTSEY